MAVRFARLRIAGFKSFADAASVEILPGLTGVVGPNGCGKSNIIEALRWAMGEANARNMRGSEMEDVIFAGTAGRAARNLAEVTLTLEDTAGQAPPPFHEQADLEISRRIERGSGSVYRVNGKEARARDVQTLLADLASGARASAMISQGRVGALVNARPDERRMLLEEAAGITGLHARRHEAELKLRGAEQNLARAEDLRGQLEARQGELQRQARQAGRYRNLSGAIRGAEAELLAIQRALAAAARQAANSALAAAAAAVLHATAAAVAAAGRAATGEAALPDLRAREGDSRTALERARIAREQSAEAETRARAALTEARLRAETLQHDYRHASRIAADAQAALARLEEEKQRLAGELRAAPAALAAAGAAAAAGMEAMRLAEVEANRLTEESARIAAESDSARRALAAAELRAQKAAARLAESETALARQRAALVPEERRAAAAAARVQAQAALLAAREAVTAREAARGQAETTLAAAREQASLAAAEATRIATEYDALAALLAQEFGRESAPVLDSLRVPPGLETALGAALREELSASADPGAARHWRELPPLPKAAESLADRVAGPPALSRALSHILLLPEGEDGDRLQRDLAPGQILVSLQGSLWRWDGYTMRGGAASQAAVRLAQRNRLAALAPERAATGSAAEAARFARVAAESAESAARLAEQAARERRRTAEQHFDRARSDSLKLDAEAEQAAARAGATQTQRDLLAAEAEEAETSLRQLRASAETLADPGTARQALEAARQRLAGARQAESTARRALEALQATGREATRRTGSLEREGADWRERGADAAGRLTDLAARQAQAETAMRQVAAAPESAAAAGREALDRLDAAQAAHRDTAHALHAAQSEADAAGRATRAADAARAAAEIALAREEGNATAAEQNWGAVTARILERIGPDAILPDPPAEIAADAEDKARRRWERLAREREEMGPVNLRAETEMQEAEAAIATIASEQAEITAAIARLRGSIGQLNGEGRARLAAVFTEVDAHFQALFTRMFGGGKAHLAMVGADDPLQAGLEIYAQPPGKKLGTLSLLSGGEQALTALSLIFAVFKCNPAPISVLDEVDAPLDDANVERFCGLLEDMVQQTGTRFLVVTHHHLTMARMDRLYGVTMQERGISRLLSVDLARAVDLLEPGRMAAD